MAKTFSGEIRVASRIVDYLSSGLYESPAACLKELINNSYDAGAEHVSVYVKPDADRIIIEDDGEGMTRTEFERHFRVISESHKRDDGDTTSSGRPKIGKIGIGFIAANEICDLMEIVSTKRGSKELISVQIDFAKMRLDPAKRRRGDRDLAEADFKGEVGLAAAQDHYTHIFLTRVRGEARSILASARSHSDIEQSRSLYGLNDESISKALSAEDLKSWAQFDSYSQNMLSVALNVPVKYHDSWIPKKHSNAVSEYVQQTSDLGFKVSYDGTDLRKPIVFCPGSKPSLVSSFEFEGDKVAASGYFFAQHGTLRPQNLNGLLIRIRHAAIGEYDPSFLDYPSSVGTIFQRWISAEVWADDRLEEAMNIDRKTLRTSHPAYLELQKAVHAHLSEVIHTARADLYGSQTTERRKERARQEVAKLQAASQNSDSKTTRSISAFSRQAKSDTRAQKALLRKYSVGEIYELAREIAEDTLSKSDADKFLKELIRRLRR